MTPGKGWDDETPRWAMLLLFALEMMAGSLDDRQLF